MHVKGANPLESRLQSFDQRLRHEVVNADIALGSDENQGLVGGRKRAFERSILSKLYGKEIANDVCSMMNQHSSGSSGGIGTDRGEVISFCMHTTVLREEAEGR